MKSWEWDENKIFGKICGGEHNFMFSISYILVIVQNFSISSVLGNGPHFNSNLIFSSIVRDSEIEYEWCSYRQFLQFMLIPLNKTLDLVDAIFVTKQKSW